MFAVILNSAGRRFTVKPLGKVGSKAEVMAELPDAATARREARFLNDVTDFKLRHPDADVDATSPHTGLVFAM